MILQTALIQMHISPMDLSLTQHPASAIRSWITWLLLELTFSNFYYFQNFPLQNSTQFLVRIQSGAWNSNSCELCVCLCVLPSRGICVELIPRQKESYGLWCVSLIVKPQEREGLGTLYVSCSTEKNKLLPVKYKTARYLVLEVSIILPHPLSTPTY